jgi:ABC-2 type transport system permease protein
MYFLIKYLLRRWRSRQASRGVDVIQVTQPSPPARPVVSASGPSAASRGPLALLAHQVRFDLRTAMRNPRARFFTIIFPVVLLVVFNGVWGGQHTWLQGHHVSLSRFYVPGILTMAIVVSTYANLVISLSSLRETGVLKRRRATPVPPGLLIASQAASSVVISAWVSGVLLIIAKVGYGVGFAPGALAAVAVAVLLGTVAFACIAYAVSGLIGNPDAAQPVVQATMLPLWFISGVFIPPHNLSSTVRTIGKLFPVEHLANILQLASVNGAFSSSVSAGDVGVLAAWALAAAGFAAWRFSWLPSTATA